RAVLAEFKLAGVDEVVASVQDLWRYGTGEWMSLRLPTNHSVRRRWPVDPIWEEIRAIRIVLTLTGVVRRCLHEANEVRLLHGLQGYATSLAARRDREQLAEAMEDLRTLVSDYWRQEEGRSLKRLDVSKPGSLASPPSWIAGHDRWRPGQRLSSPCG